MCSIFGVVLARELSVMQRLKVRTLVDCMALAGASRGTDAAGLGVVWPGRKYHVIKDSQASYHMVRRTEWKDALYQQDATPLAILGHTRAKTHGDNTRENAHPFAFEINGVLETIGVHNGVISNYQNFVDGKYEVDSQNLFAELANTEPKELGSVLYRACGSYAVAFLHRDRFYLARNPSSPMVTARVVGIHAMVYASTSHMLHLAASQSGLRLSHFQELRPGRLYHFDWKKASWHTHTYETFSKSSGLSLGRGRVREKSSEKIKSSNTVVTEEKIEETITYEDNHVVTRIKYKCQHCKQQYNEVTALNRMCYTCESRHCSSSVIPPETKCEPLTAVDNLKSISEARIAQLLEVLDMGGYVPCTSCHSFHNKHIMQRSSVVPGVLCSSCESTAFAKRWADVCKTKGTHCTKCGECAPKVRMILRPTPQMVCDSCFVRV